MKRVLAIFMAVIMLLTMVPSMAFAEDDALNYLKYKIENDEVTITDNKNEPVNLVIPAEIEGKPVTSISNIVYEACSSLQSITIPDSVTSIEINMHSTGGSLSEIIVDKNNKNYSSIDGVLFDKDKTELIRYPVKKPDVSYTIPNSVINIGYCAFFGCRSLQNITIPDSVTSIDNSAFFSCSSLQNITIPDTVTSIGNRAFSSCSSLATITVNEKNKNYSSIDGVLFSKDKADIICYPEGKTETSYIIPNFVTSIGNCAFYGCFSLQNITIPDTVTSIGNRAFYSCSSFQNIVIPNAVTSIGNSAFYGCISLQNITIPNSVTSIGNSAFFNCRLLTTITVNENNKNYSSINGVLFSKDKAEIICYPAGKLESSYTIPDSVTSIGNSAFSGCSSLQNIVIPNAVTSIGIDAFYKTAYYKDEANWENGLLYIGNHLICAKKDISGGYEVKYGTITIADGAFSSCSSLERITIPDSVINIGSGAFSYCSTLESITIPNSVTNIGFAAFANCNSLQSVVIPASVEKIGIGAFAAENLNSLSVDKNNPFYDSRDNCNAIIETSTNKLIAGCKNTVIPTTVNEIGFAAFFGATDIFEVPENIKKIDVFAIAPNEKLKGIRFENSNIEFSFDDLYAFLELYYKEIDRLLTEVNKQYAMEQIYDLLKQITFYGYEGSTAQKFAAQYEIPFEIIGIAHTHTFGEWIIDKEPNFKNEGLKIRYCQCGEFETETIPKKETVLKDELTGVTVKITPNSFDEDVFLVVEVNDISVVEEQLADLSNCTPQKTIFSIKLVNKDGEKVQPKDKVIVGVPITDDVFRKDDFVIHVHEDGYCTLEGHYSSGMMWVGTDHFSYFVVVDSSTHVHNEIVVPGTPATCTEKGLSDGKKCSVCGEVTLKQVETPTIGHEYTEVVTKPTCTEGGFTTRTCKNCGHVVKDDEAPATGHTPSDWIVEKAATVDAEGLEIKKCTVCEAKLEERAIPKLTPSFMLGDINGDNKVTASDARIILRISAKLEKLENQKVNIFAAADVNGDGKITSVDARKVLRVSTKLEQF